jgi:hypothetical protein
MSKTFKVLSVDAWADEGDSWTWNQWFDSSTYDEETDGPLTEANALAFFERDYFAREDMHLFEIDDDQYNLVLIRKDNRRPVYAIEYGGL